ncbi:MAG: hypothetical protein MUC53_16410 [Candidatus Contendobacter sp.]|nr:hypothetical protein [Candidatus Contendobacter sp.]
MNIRKMAGPALLATTLLVGGLALAADARKPSGTVVIDETQFARSLWAAAPAAAS